MFGRADVPTLTDAAASDNLDALSEAAWDAGLLALPGDWASEWTTSELRRHLSLGQPVVVFVGSRGLPGHPPGEDIGEQPLVLIGTTETGFVYSDPTFASSLGYGLQISETDLLTAWDAATRPRQALAFMPRPRPQRNRRTSLRRTCRIRSRASHRRSSGAAVSAADRSACARGVNADSRLAASSGEPVAAETSARVTEATRGRRRPPADWSWTVLLGLVAISGGTLAVRLWRARCLS